MVKRKNGAVQATLVLSLFFGRGAFAAVRLTANPLSVNSGYCGRGRTRPRDTQAINACVIATKATTSKDRVAVNDTVL